MNIKNFDSIKRKLNEKLSPVTCPMCKSNQGFTPFNSEFHQVSYNREGNQLNPNNIEFASTILCRCNHCGFLAMFDMDKLLE